VVLGDNRVELSRDTSYQRKHDSKDLSIGWPK
jgi:hypothetical protein